MENQLETFLSSCSEMDFGTIYLSDGEKDFYKEFNSEIISLCDSLPESAQTDALLFLMTYSGISIGQELNFFKNYYAPSWSVIYWLTQCSPGNDVLTQVDIENAMTAHSMAMILHSLDDHINDRELTASHLILLLRSQGWMIMIEALKNLSYDIDQGEKIVSDFLDDYYSSILGSNDINTLDSYCDLFRKQMATWLIVPVLMTKKMTTDEEFTIAVQIAYESFGIAWRLLDDINDIETDLEKGSHSSVYTCLPNDIKKLWDQNDGEESNHDKFSSEIIYDSILKNKIVYRLQKKICRELKSAASMTDNYNMIGLANEYLCLSKPMKG